MHTLSPVPINKEISPALEACIGAYADAVIQEEREGFSSGLESSDVHTNKIRQEIESAMCRFYHNLQTGYETIGVWLETHGISCPTLSNEGRAMLDTPEQFLVLASDGKQLFEILGFSEETMRTFYKAAYEITQNKEFEKGRNAFFFLVLIAPAVADFWLGLAICTTQLKEYDTALDAILHAIDSNPTQLQYYFNVMYLYLQRNDAEKARILCEEGIDFAKSHSQEPWAQELILALKNAHATLQKRG